MVSVLEKEPEKILKEKTPDDSLLVSLHYDKLLTLNVYTDSDRINSHGVPEFDSFIDDILPSDEPQVIDYAFSQPFLDLG